MYCITLLTLLEDLVADVADTDRLVLPVLDGRLVGGAGGADHLATGPAVVPPDRQTEVNAAQLAHGHSLVRDPDRGGVPQGQAGRPLLLRADEAHLLTDVLLYGAVDGLYPVISLIDISELFLDY